jgi:hypothetical protein
MRRLVAAVLLIAGILPAWAQPGHSEHDARTAREPAALRAARGQFDASGEVPCAWAVGQPMSPCAFGVARDGREATVVVTRPDGRARAIFFRDGRAIGADIAQADGDIRFSVSREGDLNMIRIGPERYEIPDAAPNGG